MIEVERPENFIWIPNVASSLATYTYIRRNVCVCIVVFQ